MCFSAEASFGASSIIATVGVTCLNRSRNIPQRVLSSIPFIFGIQQFVEGVLWLSLSQPAFAPWVNVVKYLFLIFAQVVWPALIPFAILLLEKEKIRQQVLSMLLVVGIILSVYLALSLVFFNVHADISCNHILYSVDYPVFMGHKGVFYLVPTILPMLVSGMKRMRVYGVLILLSFLTAKIFFTVYLVSVWCFFAAVTSILVLLIINKLNKEIPIP